MKFAAAPRPAEAAAPMKTMQVDHNMMQLRPAGLVHQHLFRYLQALVVASLLTGFVAAHGPAAFAQGTDAPVSETPAGRPPAASPASPIPYEMPPARSEAPASQPVAADTPSAERNGSLRAQSLPPPPRAAAPLAISREHLPHELSPWGMFMAADRIVKGVMILLAVASVLVWSMWFAKIVQLLVAKRRIGRRCRTLDGAASLSEAAARLGNGREPAARMAMAAIAEIQRSDEATLPAEGIKERIGSSVARIEAAAARAMNSGTGILATVGGTAPFIGLFGTVWGIMNSFIGISKSQTTNLAVVAPGIAEALLATAIGLVAAIPAVVFYNQLARSIAGYRGGLADAAAAVERLASRDLDRFAATGGSFNGRAHDAEAGSLMRARAERPAVGG